LLRLYVIFLGLPGAGKGTQAARLTGTTGLAHVTTGELFRENIRNETELGKKAKEFVEGGLLVPDEITIGMLLDRIAQPDCAKGFMLDGFPRTIEQAEALDRALEGQGQQIDKTIYVEVSPDELVRRLTGRWNCKNCGAVYHEVSQPPAKAGICDNCGYELYQREDDKPEVVRTRLEVNLKNLEPLLDYYGKQGKVTRIDGERDADTITQDISKVLSRN
jgi:adenylate kinase